MSGADKVKTVDMKPKEKKMTPEQQAAAEKAYRKQEATRLAEYKKNLRSSVELKRLQVEELELNIRMYDAKIKWRGMASKVEELEAKEQAEYLEERRKRTELIKAQEEEALKKAAEEKPDIVIPKVGKARDK